MKKKPDKHVFVCINCREEDRKSCGNDGLKIRSELVSLTAPLKNRVNVRINKSGCLDACELGPSLVIYPEKIWYKNVQIDDCKEILEKSILDNKIISRLEIKDDDLER